MEIFPRDIVWRAGGRSLLRSGTLTSRTSRKTAPFGRTAPYVVADGAAAKEYIYEPVTFTGDGEKCAAVFLRANTAAKSTLSIFDASVAQHRHTVMITWTAGVPTLA